MKDFFARLSWADYIAVGFMVRGLYVGYKSGIFAELLRVIGYFVSVVTAMLLAEITAQFLTLNTFLNEATAKVIGFVACFMAAFFLTLILRKMVIKILKVSEGDGLQRILGAALAGARWIVFLSLIFMAVDHSPLKQLQADVRQRSLTGSVISDVAPAIFGFTGQLTAQWGVATAGSGKAK